MKLSPTNISSLPETPGVYRFFDASGSIIYIGKAVHLKRRVSSYFQKKDHDTKTAAMVPQVSWIEITQVESEFEALLLEAALIKKHHPKYNIIWKDDKQYIYIKITKETFPRILFSRQEDEQGARYFGPFPSKRIVLEVLSYIRSIIPYCAARSDAKKACFYTHIGLCDPCPADIKNMAEKEKKNATRRYQRHIKQIISLLEGNISRVRSWLVEEMTTYATQEAYESAAKVRNRLHALELLVKEYHAPDAYIQEPELRAQIREKEATQLTEILRSHFPHMDHIQVIECYDISNISGTNATGSLVTFQHGDPLKSRYRRFRIRKKDTPDDFAMMHEMLTRRMNHTEWQLPHLIVIDGGTPQLRALKDVLISLKNKTPVVGLAKQDEKIVIPKEKGAFEEIDLPEGTPALHLLQRIRDEAHRFAKSYHTHLRGKSMYR